MKQGEFREIMVMSRNEIAMPKRIGMQREYAVNQALMLNRGKFKLERNKYMQLLERQAYLLREMQNNG